jgi:hypothetical protein
MYNHGSVELRFSSQERPGRLGLVQSTLFSALQLSEEVGKRFLRKELNKKRNENDQ